MPRFRSLKVQMAFNSILIATLTAVIAVWLFGVSFAQYMQNVSIDVYMRFAMNTMAAWQVGEATGQPYTQEFGQPVGFGLVVAPDGEVVFTEGDTSCAAGMQLIDCYPQATSLEDGQRFITTNGQRWGQVVLPLTLGHRIITERGPYNPQLGINLGDRLIYGNLPFLLAVAGTIAVISIPVSIVLSSLFNRHWLRRVSRVTQTSRAFAAGDFSVRVDDRQQDEIGLLAQQFDDMADTLEQNIDTLRDLVQQNAQLTSQVEHQAVENERSRLSRDLHDSLAQRLFSLSSNAATLPSRIERGDPGSTEQARYIAELAEEAQLDLRSMIVNLRPAGNSRHGLADSLHDLCREWSRTTGIPAECTLALSGSHIPAGLEEILYRVTQESLNNVAKHAQASEVNISLLEGQHQITLSVTDNGQGFDPDHDAKPGHLGLLGMRERTRSVGGELFIESDSQQGTTLRVVLPLKEMVM